MFYSHEIDITPHKDVEAKLLMNVKLVRYQTNPTANWGPQSRAKGKGNKSEQEPTVGKDNTGAAEVCSSRPDTVME